MKYIAVQGLKQGCSQVIIGTSFFAPEQKDNVFQLLDRYVELGGNTIDTSHIYGMGKSECVLAMWLKSRRNRKNIIIINKGCHHYIDKQGVHYPEQKRVSPKFLTQDLTESLARMGVDFFDIYLIHRDDPEVPVGDLIDVLEEHKNAGLIKAYGVSNWSTERIEAANQYATSKGYAGVVVNSPSISLAQAREPRWVGCTYADDQYIKWHIQAQIPLFGWAAQASGFFTGEFTPDKTPNSDIVRVYYNTANWQRYNRAEQLAKQKGDGITANNIALAYVLNQPFPICAVIGPQKVENLLSSCRSIDIHLTTEELQWLQGVL